MYYSYVTINTRTEIPQNIIENEIVLLLGGGGKVGKAAGRGGASFKICT